MSVFNWVLFGAVFFSLSVFIYHNSLLSKSVLPLPLLDFLFTGASPISLFLLSAGTKGLGSIHSKPHNHKMDAAMRTLRNFSEMVDNRNSSCWRFLPKSSLVGTIFTHTVKERVYDYNSISWFSCFLFSWLKSQTTQGSQFGIFTAIMQVIFLITLKVTSSPHMNVFR